MHVPEHSTVREGLLTGVMGAILMAGWYFVADVASGRPFHTPNVLGKILFRGDLAPGVRQVVPEVVAGYTAVHLVMFGAAGILLALVTHAAVRDLTLRMGLWIGLVVAFCFFAGVTYALAVATGERLPLWSVLGGSLLAVAAMGWYLLRRHPRLHDSRLSLGDEVEPPPHPDGRRA
jgi:hypothetical protein